MNTIKFIRFFLIISLLINSSCTNTRVLLEGTKKVLNKDKEIKNSKEGSDQLTLGHYKVGNPYKVDGKEYIPMLVSEYDETGIASWYGPKFHLKRTANGEIFDQDEISAAHKTLPLPSIVKVTNINNRSTIYLRVNDRGPFVNDRIIDFSKQAAIKFNFYKNGIADVRVQLIDSGPHLLEKKFLNHNFLSTYAREIEGKKIKKKDNSLPILLQIGVFKDKNNALNLLNLLKNKIEDNSFIKDNIKINNQFIYKVFVGPFEKEEYAKKTAEKLLELGFSSIYKKE